MTLRGHVPALLFEAGTGSHGSGRYLARVLCARCRLDLGRDWFDLALGDLRARGVGPRLLARLEAYRDGVSRETPAGAGKACPGAP